MPGSVQSIERAAAVLRLLATDPAGLGVSELAAALGLAKTTVHGIVRTLCQVGFAEQDPASGRYVVGAGLRHLAPARLDVHELRSRTVNWADSLAAHTGESVRVGTLAGEAVVVVHHVFRPDDTEQVLEVGWELPVHATAMGKVLLAWSGSRSRTPADLTTYTRRTITDPGRLATHLAGVRRQGWATNVEEHTYGTAGLAAPVRGPDGSVVAAIGVTGEVERICRPDGVPRQVLLRQVVATARAVSRELADAAREAAPR